MSRQWIRIVERPRLRHLLGGVATAKPFSVEGREFIYTGSGKAAIAVILAYLREGGILSSKNAPVVMPPWLGIQIYHTVQNHAAPQLAPSGHEKVLFVYHQYGFPQDMDRVIDYAGERSAVVIEDCAHAPASRYRGRPVGSFGEFGVFSFSKFLFCFALGGVAFRPPEFRDFVTARIAAASRGLTRLLCLFKYADERNLARLQPRRPRMMTMGRKAAYALYPDAAWPAQRGVRLWEAGWRTEIDRRRERYRAFRAAFDRIGICDHLEPEGVVPWVIPIKVDDARAARLLAALRDARVESGIYHFDMNRFLIEPDFQPCVTIPCHGALTDAEFARIVEVVGRTL